MGNAILEKLTELKPFCLIHYKTYDDVVRGVRRGDDYFGLIIPEDFSQKAIPGNDVARLQLITSGGTNYVATLMAERFSQILANDLNDKIATERWRKIIFYTTELAKKGEMLHGATEKLALGLSNQGLFGALVGLPSETDMKKLAEGAKLYQGKIEELAAGLDKAKDIGDKGDTLAVSVLPEQKDLTPVTFNGEAYSPYFMCLSIWLGGVMSAFLFHLVIFPAGMEGKSKTAKIIGKGLAPTTITLIGAMILGLVVQFWMRVPVLNPLGYYTTLIVAVIVFNSLILSFVKMVGDAGKLIAVLFLVIELSSSGGIYPIQTSPEFYQFFYPYMPLTHVLNALRASMFGSYDGDWMRYLLFLIPWLAIGFSFAFFSADRYKYVPEDQYGPALTLSFKREGPEMRRKA
ncbi:MAG: hypothetical protein HZC17_06605 [Candidatus Omnitrophica bacterium]|nr:hypothetical protein [Candidatus Omnitrophota bacterium]